jgi:hypothetical protein
MNMTRRFALCLVLVIVLANAGATCLYSGAGPTAPTSFSPDKPWNAALEAIANLLTLPLPTAGSADIRDVVLPVGLGIVLLMLAVQFARPAAVPSGSPDESSGRSAEPKGNPAENWLIRTAVAVTILSALSAVLNSSFELSWGWILRFAIGAGWAVAISRTLSPSRAKQVILGLLAVAILSLLLSFAYRADRDLAYFLWPIGPVTITGALAAMWAAMAGGLIAGPGRSRAAMAGRAFGVIVLLVSAYALEETGRRSPAMGLLFAALVVGAVLVRLWYPKRITTVLIAAAVIVAIGAATFYVVAQLKSSAKEKAGPVALRFEYWRLTGSLIGKHPLLGTGPDTLIVDLTTLVAPLRAYAPQFYHGNIDPYAHNEWLQAAAELGLPAGILYLALPIGVIVCGIRRLYRRDASREDRADDAPAAAHRQSTQAMIAALIAGLVAIMVLDAASIALRGPIMPIWYWTLLGLLAGLCRPGPTSADQPARVHPEPASGKKDRKRRAITPPGPVSRPGLALALAVIAVMLFILSFIDIDRAIAGTRRTVCSDTCRLERLWAEKTISAQRENTLLALNAALAQPRPENLAVAESVCRQLYQRMPGQPEAAANYANALLMANKTAEAKQVLDKALSPQLDPFNLVSNMLYAQGIATDPVEKLRCLQRAIRSAALDDMLKAIIAEILQSPAAREYLDRELLQARQVAAGKLDQNAAEPAVELLRISAVAKEQSGRWAEAIADQRLAAEFYRRLEQEQSPYRRRFEAEVDAFQQLARMLYASDPQNFRQAYDAIVIAEKYAVLGIKHESVAHPNPKEGYVGGEVIPTEFPENMRPLWQLSALLHVLAGDEQHLLERVLSSLPQTHLTNADIQREIGRLYRQACAELTRLPAASRPGYAVDVCNMAGKF